LFKHRELLIAHLIGWAAYGLFEHLSHLVFGDNHWQGSLGGAVVGALLTALLAFLYKHIYAHAFWLKILVLAITGFIAAIIWHNVTRLLHHRETLAQILQSDLSAIMGGSSYSVLLFAAWTGLYLGISFYLEKQQQLKNSLLYSEQAKEAQLQSLRYQLNPHFLFNVLNSIDVAVQEKENDTAHNMLVKLSRLLRVTLESNAVHKIPLAEEISLLDDFVAIEKERYVESIHFEQYLPEETLCYLVPSLILQPLIENAIKFTWQAQEHKKIMLYTLLDEGNLLIKLVNPSNPAFKSKITGTNTGLNNIIKRIKTLYGNRASLTTCNDTKTFTVILKLPQEKY